MWEKYSGKLFARLMEITKDDAQKERFNPRSYMRLLKDEDREYAVSKLEEEYGEKLNENIKVAILISMVPNDLQEKIFEIEKGTAEIKYQAANYVAVAMALRRRPKEDEINAIERKRHEEEGEQWAMELDEAAWWENSSYGEEADVNAVGMGRGSPSTKCHKCGGIGRMARECCIPLGHALQGRGRCQSRRQDRKRWMGIQRRERERWRKRWRS